MLGILTAVGLSGPIIDVTDVVRVVFSKCNKSVVHIGLGMSEDALEAPRGRSALGCQFSRGVCFGIWLTSDCCLVGRHTSRSYLPPMRC
jgi:hypothetical protein